MTPSSRHALPLLATLLLALAGCDGTPFGQQLAAGFDSPAPPAAATPPASGTNRPVAATGSAVSPAGSNPATPAAGANATIPATAAPASGSPPTAAPATTPGTQTPSPTPAAPARPASGSSAVNRPAGSQAPAAAVPYRITLKLPGADPSAPAEAVTKALRAAGLRFEVETIERIPTPEAAAAAPKSTPAPPPR
ncbi:hypothetical protein KBY97_05045 [Synechococcus sp. ATX 2A4]|uniref:hypothetical protein n=1 Tax=Synechococcus sp. ATX 2A4 TaxID=2823727 RepID=UPI0020CFDF7A|nr:hypothetical protein [Synechococcus sp. ATX 2A4]MCP9884494.1 hypothetical protein [Synechococcus sp. ATX 2A4]